MTDKHPFGQTLSEMDLTAFLNMRDWLEQTVVDAGAKTTDAGIGAGQADIGIVLDGHAYGISIRPRGLAEPTEPTNIVSIARKEIQDTQVLHQKDARIATLINEAKMAAEWVIELEAENARLRKRLAIFQRNAGLTTTEATP